MKACALALLLCLLAKSAAFAKHVFPEDVPEPPPAPTGEHVTLPQSHAYQKTVRDYLAKFDAEAFLPVAEDLKAVPFDEGVSADDRFRTFLLSVSPPSVGYKRNRSSVRIHPAQFMLVHIEGKDAVMRPPAHAPALVDLAHWRYGGNPHAGSRAILLRAFVLSAVDLIMLDDRLETSEKPLNQDRVAGLIAQLAYVAPSFKGVVSDDVYAAYLAGLKRVVDRLIDAGPRKLSGRTQGFYTTALPALALASKVIDDASTRERAEAFARTVYTDPTFFHGAGYFPQGGTLDSFNGISLYYAVWGAIASDWPFADKAIAAAYRLRAHLTLPEPDGKVVGPSHMAALTSEDPPHDQWDSPARAWAAALVTDEAACFVPMPDEDRINQSPANAAGRVNGAIHELSWVPGGLDAKPWSMSSGGLIFNFAHWHYPKGYYERRVTLDAKTQMDVLPARRADEAVHNFDDELLAARASTHVAIVHSGPVGDPGRSSAPHGFGGGALSAFWTPDAGAVILGRGIGAWSPQYKKRFEAWQSIPSHAVLGVTDAGKVFTSADIVQPDSATVVSDDTWSVTAKGPIPARRQGDGELLAGAIAYARTFEAIDRGVRITTTIKGDGKDTATAFYESIPVYLGQAGPQLESASVAIAFQVDGEWRAADETFATGVTAIRISRFNGAVVITLSRPARVKLAPVWQDRYMSKAVCRNVLIDLLGSDAPVALEGERSVSYRIEAAAK